MRDLNHLSDLSLRAFFLPSDAGCNHNNLLLGNVCWLRLLVEAFN